MNCCFNGEWQQTVLRLLSNLKTRDALYRVMQFSLRVVLAVRGIAAANRRSANIFARLMNGAGVSPVDAKLQTTVSALATGRKVLAFGNIASELPNFFRLAKQIDMKNLRAETVLPLLRSACMLNFWVYDHLSWLAGGAKVLPMSASNISVVQSKFWFVAVLCSLTLDTMALKAHARDLQEATPEKATQLTKTTKTLALHEVRDLCDLVVASNNSKFVRMPPLLVGICGAFSAASIVYEAVVSAPSGK